MRPRIHRGLMALALCAAAGLVSAQSYPSKPIRLIVPYPAGGGTDAIARMVSDRMSARLGQPVIVENIAGAGGIVGTENASRAAADGYTLVLGTSGTIVMGPHLRKLPYDPVRDFAPVGQITSGGLVLVTTPQTGIKNVADMIARAKAEPGGLSYATGGVGTGGHIIGESLKYLTQAPLVHVGYKGTAAASTDLLGGHVPMMIGDTQVTLPYISAGRMKAFAVAGTERAECLPDVPTLKEQGVDFDLTYWWGLLAPAQTPKAIVERLNKELNAVLAMPETQAQLRQFCQGGAARSPGKFGETIASDIATWGKLIRAANIRAE